MHVVDLDARTHERVPGPDSAAFGTDGLVHEFNDITPPEVGSPMLVWFDDMDEPQLRERWHRTSWVRRIERVEAAESSTG
ncbi:hypothetical protein [Nocardioides sp.]|uniref:hypothetical protein n=1 Tax=Nocardioides sp. TaxID=35761 RepID=UPI0035B00B76